MAEHRKTWPVGSKYGRWTVIGPVVHDRWGGARLLCACDCGTVRMVYGNRLGTGSSSCGCLNREKILLSTRTHGESGGGNRLLRSLEYVSWVAMKARCLNPGNARFARYGGRGITVHPAWLNSFETFLADVGRRPSKDYSLDRIDNDGNYEPGNVRWATRIQQQNNRRRNHRIEFNGLSLTLPEWARKLDVPKSRLFARLADGWTVERAFTEPFIERKYRKWGRREVIQEAKAWNG